MVDAARAALPEIQAAAPNGLELKLDFDQSVFVRGAVVNVIREAIISSILVSLLILVFLGSWRNTVIVSTSSRCRSSPASWVCSSPATRST